MRGLSRYICYLLLALPIYTSAQTGPERLLHGEILFESLQGNHLEAIVRFDTEQLSDISLSSPGSLSLADLELALGLSSTAEENIKSRSADKITQQLKNRDAYRLAWFYYNKRKPMQALEVLDSIEGKTEGVSSSDIEYLRALVYLGVGRFNAAAELLYELPLYDQPRGYTSYNLAMARIQGGNEERGRSTLDSLGRINTTDADLLALKDMANLKLGYRYLQEGSLEQAKASFNHVRLDGPFSNQALLVSGWASFSMGKIDRAIVPWTVLHEQEVINDTIIEAKMALPYAYSKLGAHGKAANLYAHAIEIFEAEIARLNTSSEAIRAGTLSQEIVRAYKARGDDWYTDVSRQNEQQGFYLPLLLSSEEFRVKADRLHELALIRHRVEKGLHSTAAYTELAGLKQKYYAAALPETEAELPAINQKMKKLVPETPEQTGGSDQKADETAEISQLRQTYRNYLHVRTATADYNRHLPDYSRELAELSKKLKRLDNKLDKAIKQTGKQMETIALATLDQKRVQLQSYLNNALFALAESYDFATGKRQ